MFKVNLSQVLLLATASLCTTVAAQSDPWQIVAQAVESRGEDAATALKMLGVIDDPVSRNLLKVVFESKNGAAISDAASGLTGTQCAVYLTNLEKAALDPEVQPKVSILDAIARARSPESARILAEVANHEREPIAGVAFGLLGDMGTLAEPLLIRMVSGGVSSWSRETATWMLGRMKVTGADAALRSALLDSDERVRVAGALGLAQLGDRAGQVQIEAAAANPASGYQIESLVGLAMLGKLDAFNSLKSLVTSATEAVRGQTVWAMARSGNTFIKDFAYRLGLERDPVFRSMLAEKLLDPNDPRDRGVFLKMIASGDGMSRLVAAHRLLGTKYADRAEPAIERALTSDSEPSRHFALILAAQHPALQRTLPFLLANPDPVLQVAALSAIADLHQKDRFKDVARCLSSNVPAVSAAAARTLVELDPQAAVPDLEQGLNSKTSYVRINSAAMLMAATRILSHK